MTPLTRRSALALSTAGGSHIRAWNGEGRALAAL